MMRAALVLTEPVWDRLVAVAGARDETAGVLLASPTGVGGSVRLLVSEFIEAPADAYLERTSRSLRLASGAYVGALQRAAEQGMVPLFLHTHPESPPEPSKRDVRVDDELREVFRVRARSADYGSVIVGWDGEQLAVSAVYESAHGRIPVDRVRVVGQRIRAFPAWSKSHDDSSVGERFDRQIRAFGRDGQRTLQELRVGVVGAGGTGSAVIEQLARLGVGHLTVVDPDHVSASNLTRIYGSTARDVGRPKAELAAEHARAINPGIAAEAIVGRITERSRMESLRACDIIFGCTDDHAGRAVLSRMAYWYLIPVIDMGVVITSRDGVIDGLYGRVTTVTPGTACLICRRRVDPNRMREELLEPAERARLVEEGYAQGLDEPDPSVVTYTTMVATYAVNELLVRLFGLDDGSPSELLLRPLERGVNRLGGTPQPGHYCDGERYLGRGDAEPPLDMVWTA